MKMDREAFWNAICAEPDEDAPRLVFADWLDDHGEHARAEFIRVQCALIHLTKADGDWWTLRDREQALLDSHRTAWQAELPRLIRASTFVRGFPTPTGGATTHELLAAADEFHAAGPIEGLWLDVHSRQVAALLNGRALDRVNHLALGFFECSPSELFQTLTAFRHPRFSRLLISHVDLDASDVARLASWPGLNQLREWEIHGCPLSAADLRPLFDSPNVGQLRRIQVSPFEADEDTSCVLSASSAFRSLEELELAWCSEAALIRMANTLALPALRALTIRTRHVGVNGAQALARCASLASLRRLTMEQGNLGSAGVRALATSPYLSGLTAASFQWVGMGDEGLSALVNSGFASRLRELTIVENAIDPTGLFTANLPELRCLTIVSGGLTGKTLAGFGSAWVSGLRELVFEGDDLGEDAARVLADAPLSSLRSLDLSGVSFADAGLATLLRADWIGGLRRLRLKPDIRTGPFGRLAVAELCECPHLSQLWELNLWCEARDESRLRDRFGERFTNDDDSIPF